MPFKPKLRAPRSPRLAVCGCGISFYTSDRNRRLCRECAKRRVRHYAVVYADRHRLLERRARGILVEAGDYERLLETQAGRCALCGTDNPGQGRRLFCLDHDHATGRVRGLLCNRCNYTIAPFEMRLEWLERVVTYLKS